MMVTMDFKSRTFSTGASKGSLRYVRQSVLVDVRHLLNRGSK